jgi:hypothetical protein
MDTDEHEWGGGALHGGRIPKWVWVELGFLGTRRGNHRWTQMNTNEGRVFALRSDSEVD